MNLGKLTKLVDDKIDKNSNKVIVEYYKVITKTETTIRELPKVIQLITIRLENLGYTVYTENEKYVYNNKQYEVQSNELIVAILNGK